MIYNKVPFGVVLDFCVCVYVCEQGTLPWNLMTALSFLKTVSQCQRWEKIISLHTVNESQRLSQPFLKRGILFSPQSLGIINKLLHRLLFFFFPSPSATCGYFQRVVILFPPSPSLQRKKTFSSSCQPVLTVPPHTNIRTPLQT